MKTINLKEISIKSIVIHKKAGEWVADIQYSVLDNQGVEWSIERTQIPNLGNADKNKIADIVTSLQGRIKTNKQLD